MKISKIVSLIVLAVSLAMMAEVSVLSQDLNVASTLRTGTDRWIPLGSQGAAFNITNTAAEVTAFSVTVPGGSLGSNGLLRVTYMITSPSLTLNNKGSILRLGGVGIRTNVINSATLMTSINQFLMWNRNDPAVQIAQASTSVGSFGSSALVKQTYSINTAVDQTLSMALTNAVSSDSTTLEFIAVDILR